MEFCGSYSLREEKMGKYQEEEVNMMLNEHRESHTATKFYVPSEIIRFLIYYAIFARIAKR
jgi:hypothetical protein